MTNLNDGNDWKNILQILANIREYEDYSSAKVDFIREQLQSGDERIRSAAALSAGGCLFEPSITDLLIDIVENDEFSPVRKAAIQSLGLLIHEGVLQNFENNIGANTEIEFLEEWDELQYQTLQEEYLRVKNLLFSIILNDFEEKEIRNESLAAISDLGFLQEVKEWIDDFIDSEDLSSQLVALYAMGKYPHHWISHLAKFLNKDTPKPLLLESISSSYSSESEELAIKIEGLLELKDPDVLAHALLTLANINKTDNLGSILQKYILDQNETVKKAAKDALKHFTYKNFSDFMEKEFGFE
jgi:HEAT repeat protein